MRNKTNITVFLLFAFTVAIFNMKIVLKNNFSRDLTMLSIEAISNGENFEDGGESDFPKDPFPDASSKAERKLTDNSYEYSYVYLHDNIYAKYEIPVTKISCIGVGKVPCCSGCYCGEPRYIGEVEKNN